MQSSNPMPNVANRTHIAQSNGPMLHSSVVMEGMHGIEASTLGEFWCILHSNNMLMEELDRLTQKADLASKSVAYAQEDQAHAFEMDEIVDMINSETTNQADLNRFIDDLYGNLIVQDQLQQTYKRQTSQRWNSQEDVILLECVEKYGKRWEAVSFEVNARYATLFGGCVRTTRGCAKRHRRLMSLSNKTL